MIGRKTELAHSLSFAPRIARSAENPVISGFFGTNTKIAPQNGKLFLYQSLSLDMVQLSNSGKAVHEKFVILTANLAIPIKQNSHQLL